MKQICPLFLILLLFGCTPHNPSASAFRLHLFAEPQQLDPAKGRSSSASYFFHSVLRGLYIYDNEKGLLPENGKCHWKTPLQLHCKLNKDFKWSNAEPVTSKDYQRSFFHLANPQTASPRSDILNSVVNAKAILTGSMKPESLGFKVIDTYTFEVYFSNPDPEFIYKLTSTALFPKHKNNPTHKSQNKSFLSNGPYKIKDWKGGQEIHLTKNKYYPKGHPKRPDVIFYVIDSDLTAFRLYESQELDFLRRVLTEFVPKLKDRRDFYQIPQARFDYIGFGEPLKNHFELRKALALSVDYSASKKVLHALGPLGCPSIPSRWMDKQPCYSFDIQKAKSALAKIPKELLEKPLIYGFSLLGGEMLKKQAEFLQNQWKKNLNINVELRMMEQKIYLRALRTKPLNMFRKGVGLDRASCTDALETFAAIGPENYTKWTHEKYESIIKKLSNEITPKKRKTLCRQGVEILMKEYRVIPLGEMHFTILARPEFRGWKLNELNQLDLSQLHRSKP